MNDLMIAREKINQIDQAMAELFEQRMQAVEDVVSYKIQHGMEVLDPSREQAILNKNVHYIKKEEYRLYYEQFMKDVMKISRSYQNMVMNQDQVAYAGVQGAFSHLAAKELFPNSTLVHYQTFEEVVKAVLEEKVSYGVLPFENSFTGEVGDTLDLCYQEPIYIGQMFDLKVNQNLLGVKGSKLEDIKQVYSHPQAISQSSLFLKGRDWEVIPYPNTALAAKYIADTQDVSKAAIASSQTAEIFHLDVLEKKINTSQDNTTRFVVIQKNLCQQGNRFNILFTTKHNAGALASVMRIIADAGFNLESIRSRSLKDTPWEYYFYIEVVGDLMCEKAQKLIQQLKEACDYVKVLGNYKKESEEKL